MDRLSQCDIAFVKQPHSGVRYTSGMDVTNEALVNGRYVTAQRSAGNGRIKQGWDDEWDSATWLDGLIGIAPVDAFALTIGGQSLHNHWRWAGARSWRADDCLWSEVELQSALMPVRVHLMTKLDGSRFIERWLEIDNQSDQPMALGDIAPMAGLLWRMRDYRGALAVSNGKSGPVFSLGYYADSMQLREGNFRWQPLVSGTFAISNETGRSGWRSPFFIARNELNGETFIAHLEWATNWKAEFVVRQEPGDRDAYLSFRFGPNAPAPQRIIAPGERLKSPVVHAAMLSGDLDACVGALHDHIRASVLPKPIEGKSLLFGQGRVVTGDDQWLLNQIDIASEMGMEFFFVDAGWYGQGDVSDVSNWYGSVGDWQIAKWLKGSLAPARDRAHALGMKFGLWIEPESAGHMSKVAAAHPDWFTTRDEGVPTAHGRLLDLAKPEVAAWVESEIFRVIDEVQPDFLKLDFNCSDIGIEGENMVQGYRENSLWRHSEAIYGIFERVRARYPGLGIENCSAGGGRLDIGMMRRFDFSCQSDWTRMPENLLGLNGMLMAFPPETLRFYYMMQPDYAAYGDFDFIMRVIMLTNPIFLDFSRDLTDINRTMLRKIGEYKKLYTQFVRPMLPTARVYHHTPVLPMERANDWCVLEYMSPQCGTGYAGLFRLSGAGESEYTIKFRGLDAAKRYRVTMHGSGAQRLTDGWELMMQGITVRLERAMMSEMILLTEEA